MAATRTSSHASLRGRRMPNVSCSFRDVFSFRFSCFIAYHTSPCANVSCQKVIYTDNSLEFGKACEDLSWNHCTSTPHRSDTNGIAEGAVRRVKEGTSACCNQVWMKNGGQIPWSVVPICETFKIPCLMGRHHRKGDAECPLIDQSFRLVHWLRITLSLRRTYRDYINLVQKSCQLYSSVMYCMRGESGKETL